MGDVPHAWRWQARGKYTELFCIAGRCRRRHRRVSVEEDRAACGNREQIQGAMMEYKLFRCGTRDLEKEVKNWLATLDHFVVTVHSQQLVIDAVNAMNLSVFYTVATLLKPNEWRA
jgi:hypothetical protein